MTCRSFDALDSSEKTIAVLGDRWWPQVAKQEGGKASKQLSAQLLNVSLLGIGTVLRLKRLCDQWPND